MDDQIKELRKLRATLTKQEDIAKVDLAIQSREEELRLSEEDDKIIADIMSKRPFVSA
jgi:spore germination protein GerM